MNKDNKKYNIFINVIVGLLILIALYFARLYNFLLFHSIAELFSIVISCGIFIIIWNSRNYFDNKYFIFISIAYLFVAIVDLLHTLAYHGMNIFQGYGTNLPTQLWILGRYIQAISLLIAPLLFDKKLNTNYILLSYISIVSISLISIFYLDIFPICYIEDKGLTLFKKVSEYVISLILFLSILFLLKKKNYFDKDVLNLLIISIILSIISELSFTLYKDPYGFFNLMGHYLKIAATYFVYKAIIVIALTKPYNLLFRDLKKKEEKLLLTQFSVDKAAVLIFWVGPNAQFHYVNDYACNSLGYTREELLSMKVWDIDPNFTKEVWAKHWESIKKYKSFTIESLHHKKNGTIYPVEVNVNYIKLGDNEYNCAFACDITERKKSEEILKKTNEEMEKQIKERTSELIKANKQLAEVKRLSDIGTLAATVAHELRNPLAAIKIAIYNIRKKVQNKNLDKHFVNIEKKIDESNQIINNLLFYSRIKMPHYDNINISDIIDECVAAAKKRFYKKRIKVIKKYESLKNITIRGDQLQLKEVFNNILNNAYDAILNKDGEIKIVGEINNKSVIIDIKDNGIGIKEEDLNRVLDPFFTTKAKGTGLGLTVSNQIINLHNGNINIESTSGKGTNVRITLPING